LYVPISMEHYKLGKPLIKYICNVHSGTLLEGGRFAFLLTREIEDLRTLIDRLMMTSASFNHGPYSKNWLLQKMVSSSCMLL
jgi:hypothetical protein